ncbi:21946_t:CDS:10 [Entrophospora sp. SA101]|nr:12745_t:CDS:10 [Entrophospora sp. SA101]CAJ0764807.1 21946_t:CDS:10 [Entrophospora sp. SA101]
MATMKPARKQVNSEMGPSKAVLNDRPGTFYNIWYNRWSGGDRASKYTREKATTRCNVELDAGETKGDKMPNAYFCLNFARGCCPFGYECHYWHRIPKESDPIDSTIDAFGRDKFNEYRDDMGGVGSFNRENRTLYVGHVHVGSDMEEIVSKYFSEWGEIEKIKILKDKGVAFVTYKSPLNAEFAKEAMTNQSLDHNEILNVRWATDDPNPRAKEEYKRKAEALAAQAIQKSLPVEFSLGGHEYFNKRPRITNTTDNDSNQDFYGLEVSTMVATILPTTTTATTVVYNEQQQQPLLAPDSTKIDNDYYNNNYGLQQTLLTQPLLKNSIVSAETLENLKILSRGFNSSVNSRKTNEVDNDKKLDKKENKSALAGKYPFISNPKTDLSKLDPILEVEKPFITPPSLPTYPALTGLTAQEIRALQKKGLIVKRVVNQTSKGRIFSMYSLVVVGNCNGLASYGEGKHEEAATSVRKATNQAIKNLQYFHRYNDRTIYHEIQYKFHRFGIRTNHYIHEICKCVGIHDLAAKVLGSRNGMNVVKATFQALETQKLPEDLAKTRGKKVVDLYRVE